MIVVGNEKDTKEEEKRKDLQNQNKRSFLLNENVTASTVKTIVQRILEINKHDAEEEKKNPLYEREPIELVIDCYGGGIYEGLLLFGVIDTSVTPVHGYCYSKAMSMGFLLYIICHRRFAHTAATFMYHNGINHLRDDLVGIERSLEQSQNLVAMGDSYIIKYTSLTQKTLDEIKLIRKDWYMFATEAKKYGIVDEILESKRNTYRKQEA